MILEPGVYKVIWHNTYSQVKARKLNFSLKVLEPVEIKDEEESKEFQILSLDQLSVPEKELFTLMR